MVLPPRQTLPNPAAHRPLLRLRLGRLPLHLRRPVQRPQLDPARLRHRPRRPEMVPDALGNLRDRPIRPLGRRTSGRRARRQESLALAGSTGRRARSRIRDDSPADADADPHRIHADRSAGAWIHRHDPGEGDGTQQDRAGGHLPGFQRRVRRGVGKSVVLGRAGFPVADLCGVFRFLPEGAAVEALRAVLTHISP